MAKKQLWEMTEEELIIYIDKLKNEIKEAESYLSKKSENPEEN